MLFLAVFATVILAFAWISCLKHGFDIIDDSDQLLVSFIGVLIGLAIEFVPIAVIWILYSKI